MNKQLYKKLLQGYLKDGFKFVLFNEFDPKKEKQIILRHDVDFSVEYALEMANIEAGLGIKASYFFLTHSLYNWHTIDFSDFKGLGHYTGLHIDFNCPIEIDEKTFKNIYSIHRPTKEHLNTDKPFSTYNKKFFTDIFYTSDSGYKEPKTITENSQLLIHPIWWMTRKGDINMKLKEWQKLEAKKTNEYISENIKKELLK
jgi:hypothetical protein